MLAEAGIKVKYVARALLRNFKNENEVSLKRWHAEEEPMTGNWTGKRTGLYSLIICLVYLVAIIYVFFYFFHQYFFSFLFTQFFQVWLWLAHMAGLLHSITWLAYASLRGHALFAYNCPILLGRTKPGLYHLSRNNYHSPRYFILLIVFVLIYLNYYYYYF